MEVKYKDDLNIVNLHVKICNQLDSDKKIIFEQKTSELLQVYRYLQPQVTQPLIFGKRIEEKIETSEDKKKIKQRLIVIARYLQIANRFININITRIKQSNEILCEECLGPLERNGGYITCKICGIIECDIDSIDTCYYNNKRDQKENPKEETMLQAILLLQGKQKKIPPQECLDKIINYCNEKKKSIEKLTIFSMYNIMQILELKEYYVYINYIYHKITGEKLPDIKEYEDKILHRYNLLYKDVSHIIKTNKSSAPRNIILLRSLLEMEGVKIPNEFFPPIKTQSVKESYNMTMKMACLHMQTMYPEQNWKFIPI
jgi:hypothetical protein